MITVLIATYTFISGIFFMLASARAAEHFTERETIIFSAVIALIWPTFIPVIITGYFLDKY